MGGQLKISSKKLRSGRFQVNFCTQGPDGFYGYLLAEPHTSVRDIVLKIEAHVRAAQQADRYLQPALFSLGRRASVAGESIMLFKNKAA
ncbi:MAG: hypothetical protein MUC38_12120 [Cyclobacteriaceae bacterium]|jgi:hypothetical protein|nr:hypothetical protein [Cyclobacteriaceae bacterium]